MECNKEEAIRAKEIAEMKMQTGDFAGAKRVVQRAQQLDPELQNVPQMLMVCEVHCSAQTKLNGSEMDWYGILQVEQFSDDANIKKQYRRLALSLHPDKNKFPGAEAAFKLIGEANRVLADPAKRSTYDMKFRGVLARTVLKPAPRQSYRSSQVPKHGAANIFSKVSYSQNTSSRPHQQPDLTTFWTCCSNCKMRFKYYKTFRNRKLRCQGCRQSFIAHDLGFEPPISTWSQFHNQKEAQNQGSTNVATQSNLPKPSFVSFSYDPIRSDNMEGKGGDVTGCSKAEGSEAGNASDMGGCSKLQQKTDKGVKIPNSDTTKQKESGNLKFSSRKKRKLEEDSNESFVAGNTEEVMMDKDGDAHSSGPIDGHQIRRSSRKKVNVTCSENLSDEDFSSPLRSKYNRFPDVTKQMKQKSNNSGVPWEDSSAATVTGSANGNAKEVKHSVTLEDDSLNKKNKTVADEAREDEASLFSDEKMENDDVELKANFEIPDAEFNNFDKQRTEACFDSNQIWALYDSVDGMPRFYAYVEKVLSPAFKLKVTWLEHISNDGYGQSLGATGLPRGCGKYKLGESEDGKNIEMFSHQMDCTRGKRGIHLIYPKKGEVWALFKQGNEQQKHGPYQFEFVEVIADIEEGLGIGVSYLRKVKGFLSIFRPSPLNGVISFCIRPEELFRFSHRIPAFRMTGNEGDGVPAGSFELDPASLPSDIDDAVDAIDVKDEENLESGFTDSCSKVSNSAKSVHKHFILNKWEHVSRFGKSQAESNSASHDGDQVDESQCVNCVGSSQAAELCDLRQPDSSNTLPLNSEGIDTTGKQRDLLAEEDLKTRRSPRDLSKKNNSANVRRSTMEKDKDKYTTDSNELKHGQSSASTSMADDKTLSHAKGGIVIGLTNNNVAWKGPARSHAVVGVKLHDFKMGKSAEKFQLGQIWALFGNDNEPPRMYGQIKKIASSPDLKLQVAMLEVCPTSKDAARPLCCGTFKVNIVEHQFLPVSQFSHLLEAQPEGKNRYEIRPRKGEIWAVYKNWRSESMTSDQKVGECDFVEVLEDNFWSVTVVVLDRYRRHRQLYWCPVNQRSKAGIFEIRRSEFARFSHPCSAFRHEGRQRCIWELDIGSIPCPHPDVILLD